MRVLFLDIDGVLNDHAKLPGSVFCGIVAACIVQLNRVIAATHCRLVLTSSWRYLILRGAMTVEGFEQMLYTHGLIPAGDDGKPYHLFDHLPADDTDPRYQAGSERGLQIADWLSRHDAIEAFAVVDDGPPGMQFEPVEDRLIRTRGDVGLTGTDADRLIELFS